MAYSKATLKSNGNRASPCFKPFLIVNMSDNSCLPGLCYTYKSDIFLLSLQYHVDTKLNENITQHLLPNWIISFLEVYKLYYRCNECEFWETWSHLRYLNWQATRTVTALRLQGGILLSSSLYCTECLSRQFTYLTLYITQWHKVIGLTHSYAQSQSSLLSYSLIYLRRLRIF